MKIFLLFTIILIGLAACNRQNTTHEINSSFKTAKEGSKEPYTDKIIGKWKSLDDSNAVIIIDKKYQKDYYQNEYLSASPYIFSNKCPDDNITLPDDDTKDIFVLKEQESNSFLCYGINFIRNDTLDMTYLGRGNTLRYHRIK